VTRLRRTLVVLLGVQVGLSLLAIARERLQACDACVVSPGFDPGMAGAAAYGVLLAGVLMRGPTPLLQVGILFGAGVHAALVAQMGVQGRFCGVCLAAAAVSAALVGISIACDRANLGRLAIIAPAAALLAALGLSAAPPPSPAAASGGVGVRIYIQPDCPYCERLRKEIVPEIVKEFGTRVRIEYRSADDLPGIRRTPTLILDPGRAESRPRIIEGLPTLERLRGAIRDLAVSL
jgi:hypothetical protein